MKHFQEFYIHYAHQSASRNLVNYLSQQIPFHMKQIVVCSIGSDRCIGDAVGPLVGHELLLSKQFPFPVFGTLQYPMHALNCNQIIEQIYLLYPNAYIIAIDACLGEHHQVGQVIVDSNPIHPGLALNKNLQPIGDISIKAIVNSKGINPLQKLQSTRLHFVMDVSRFIANALIEAAITPNLQPLHNPNYNSYNYNTWQ